MAQLSSERTGTITAIDGTRLFHRHYPAADEKARMVLVHGLGEHSGRYGHVIERLLKKQISVWTYDQRGFGQSDGPRGHVKAFSEYIGDLDRMVTMAREKMPDRLKFYLIGHSMGGLIVLNYAEKFVDALNGVIASSPGLAPAMKVPVIKGNLGRLMSFIWPSLTFDNELIPEHLSHDAAAVKAYVEDPLVHRRISSRWFTEYLKAMAETNQAASKITIPTLMQVAGDDRIVSPRVSRDFFERIESTDKTLCFYDGLFHEIYNEKDDHRQRVLSDLENWLDDHL